MIGRTLGPYRVLGKLGEGGMGEVYRARDDKLQRDVAIKVLPSHVAEDPAALARFEREARSVAQLSHPNILTIFDFGREGDRAYAVTELLEGETLRERLTSGPLMARRAIEYALQIGRGLGAAHEKGIVHRDLKPENLFLTREGTLKILDFGLAKSVEPAGVDADRTHAMTAGRTGAGTILGTLGYMAPEQIRGLVVDHRTDLFAFGAVLYEMLSGRRAFAGNTPADTMTAILTREPPALTAVVEGIRPGLDRIVRRCLEKEPEQRFQSARDLAFALESLGDSQSTIPHAQVSVPPSRWRVSVSRLGVVGVLGGVLAGVALGWRLPHDVSRPDSAPAPPAVFSFDAGYTFPLDLLVSPDARVLAYNAPTSFSGATGTTWLRRMDAASEPVALSKTTVDWPLAWSPDSRRLLVATDDALQIVDIANDQRSALAAASGSVRSGVVRGAVWLTDQSLLVGLDRKIVRFTPGVAGPQDAVALDPDRDLWHANPVLLPGGRVLFAAQPKGDGAVPEMRVMSLDRPDAGAPIGLSGVVRAEFGPPDTLLYVRAGSLFAQKFDAGNAVLSGEPHLLARDVYDSLPMARAAFSVSNQGLLTYRTERFPLQTFGWVDRAGRVLSTFQKRDTFSNFDVSPDDARVAVTVRAVASQSSLWLLDFDRNLATDISERDASHSDATWSPDGERLAFRLGSRVVVRAVDGGPLTTVFDRAGYPETWSPDGRYLIQGVPTADGYELWTVDLFTGQSGPLVAGAGSLDEPKFSPDGKWVAYNGSDAGRTAEVYAIPFPPTGQRHQLSASGGTQPRWRRDGEELYYLAPDGTLMVVRIPGGDVRRATPAEPLFQTTLEASSAFDQYVPSADGQRFLLRRPEGGVGDRAPIHVIVNWRSLLPDGW